MSLIFKFHNYKTSGKSTCKQSCSTYFLKESSLDLTPNEKILAKLFLSAFNTTESSGVTTIYTYFITTTNDSHSSTSTITERTTTIFKTFVVLPKSLFTQARLLQSNHSTFTYNTIYYDSYRHQLLLQSN